MRTKIVSSVVAVLLLLLSFALGYLTGYSHARQAPRIIIDRDTSDAGQGSAKSVSEPYFTKRNAIPNEVR